MRNNIWESILNLSEAYVTQIYGLFGLYMTQGTGEIYLT